MTILALRSMEAPELTSVHMSLGYRRLLMALIIGEKTGHQHGVRIVDSRSWGGTKDGTQEWKHQKQPKREWEKKHCIQKSWAKSPRSYMPDYAETQSGTAQHSRGLSSAGYRWTSGEHSGPPHWAPGPEVGAASSLASLNTNAEWCQQKSVDGMKHFGP